MALGLFAISRDWQFTGGEADATFIPPSRPDLGKWANLAHFISILLPELDPFSFVQGTLNTGQVIPVQVLADLPHAGFSLRVEDIALDQPHTDLLDGFKSMHPEFLEAVSRGSAWADNRTSSTARWPAPQEPKVGYRG